MQTGFWERLRTEPDFADLSGWQMVPIAGGQTSAHLYRLRGGAKDRSLDLVVKEIKPNEQEILARLASMNLRHLPTVLYPDLLQHAIFVTRYYSGGPAHSKTLEPGVIRDLATLQNGLGIQPADPDSAYIGFTLDHAEKAERALARMQAEGVPLADAFGEIYRHVAGDPADLARRLCEMPVAWLHNDLREVNLIGRNPQMVLDWGSSYGYGPFLDDLAPYLLGRPQAMAVFIRASQVARSANRVDLKRWLNVAAASRFLAFCCHIHDLSTPEILPRVLAYEHRTWRLLLPT